MVDVREMGMAVEKWCMGVAVGVRFRAIPWAVMFMVMMGVVDMAMHVGLRLMEVGVGMRFGQVEIDAQGHEACRRPEEGRQGFVPEPQRHPRAEEGGAGKVGTGTGAAQMSQCHHEEDEAESVAKRPHGSGGGNDGWMRESDPER